MPARVLIAGAGVAALEAALALRSLAADRVDVELLGPEHHFWYRPLSVTEPFAQGEATRYELPALAVAAGAHFTPGTLLGVDAARREAKTSVGDIGYDFLLVAVGVLPSPAVAGAVTFRGAADREKLESLLDDVVAGRARRLAFAVPEGAVWPLPLYELALLTAAYVAQNRIEEVELTLATPEAAPLQVFGDAAGSKCGCYWENGGFRCSAARAALVPGRRASAASGARARGGPRRRCATPARRVARRPPADPPRLHPDRSVRACRGL